MFLENIPSQAQYVVNGEGHRSAVLLDIDVWQELVAFVESITVSMSHMYEQAQKDREQKSDSTVTPRTDGDREQGLIVEFPPEAISAFDVPLDELEKLFRRELALAFYQQHRLSVGKAREFAQMTRWDFEDLLGARRIIRHYTKENLLEDIEYALNNEK